MVGTKLPDQLREEISLVSRARAQDRSEFFGYFNGFADVLMDTVLEGCKRGHHGWSARWHSSL